MRTTPVNTAPIRPERFFIGPGDLEVTLATPPARTRAPQATGRPTPLPGQSSLVVEAVAAWDEALADHAGLLNATVVP